MCESAKEPKPLAVEAHKEPEFSPGDRVQTDYGEKGRIVRITHVYHVEEEGSTGYTSEYEAGELAPLVLTESDVWVATVLLIHRIVESGEFEYSGSAQRQEEADKQIRHQVYQFIGGHKLKVTADLRGYYGKVQAIIDSIRQQRGGTSRL